MSYANIIAGLKTRLETLDGLASVLTAPPTAIHDTPMVYMLLDSGDVTHQAQVVTTLHSVTLRLVVRWQENEEAEKLVQPYVDSVVDAIRGDPYLDGNAQNAWISHYEGGWATIAGVEYRVVDFTATVKDVRS